MEKILPWPDGTGNLKITYSGDGNDTITIVSDKNLTGAVRSMNIAIKTIDGSVTHTIKISQAAAGDFEGNSFNDDFFKIVQV